MPKRKIMLFCLEKFKEYELLNGTVFLFHVFLLGRPRLRGAGTVGVVVVVPPSFSFFEAVSTLEDFASFFTDLVVVVSDFVPPLSLMIVFFVVPTLVVSITDAASTVLIVLSIFPAFFFAGGSSLLVVDFLFFLILLTGSSFISISNPSLLGVSDLVTLLFAIVAAAAAVEVLLLTSILFLPLPVDSFIISAVVAVATTIVVSAIDIPFVGIVGADAALIVDESDEKGFSGIVDRCVFVIVVVVTPLAATVDDDNDVIEDKGNGAGGVIRVKLLQLSENHLESAGKRRELLDEVCDDEPPLPPP